MFTCGNTMLISFNHILLPCIWITAQLHCLVVVIIEQWSCTLVQLKHKISYYTYSAVNLIKRQNNAMLDA